MQGNILSKNKSQLLASTAQLIALGRSGSINEARDSFEKIPQDQRDTAAWNAMISCYSKNKDAEKAKGCFDAMQQCGSRNVVTYNTLLAAYAQAGHLEQAVCVFNKMPSRSFVSWNQIITAYAQDGQVETVKLLFNLMPEKHVVARNAMLKVLVDEGLIMEAKHFFESSVDKNIASWGIMLHGYSENGHLEDSQLIFEMMPCWNTVCCNSMLITYSKSDNINKSMELFNVFIRTNEDLFSVNLMLKALLSSACIEEAKSVFYTNKRNMVSWNTMLHGLADNDFHEDVLALFEKMPKRNVISCMPVITVYAHNGDINLVKDFYATMVMEKDITSGNVLLQAYVQHRRLNEASRVFQEMPQRTIVSWTTVLHAYADQGHFDAAKHMFDVIPAWSLGSCNAMLRAFAEAGHFQDADDFFRNVMPERNLLSWNVILRSTVDHGRFEEAKVYFDDMPVRDLISWEVMLAAYSRDECSTMVQSLFKRMPMVDLIAWNTVLAGHSKDHDLKELFNEMPQRDVVSWNTLLAGYAQNGRIEDAGICLKRMPSYCITGCNIMLAGYIQSGQVDNARRLFEAMENRDGVSWTSMISGYAQIGHMVQARQLFDDSQETGLFSRMEILVVLWNVMFMGYAHNTDVEAVDAMHKSMELQGIKPNAISFLCILVAFSHSGSVKDGQGCFLLMTFDHGISPWKDHYCTMVDLLARGGYLQEAEELLENMPFLPDTISWQALLGACKNHSDLERAERVANHAFELDIEDPTPYSLLSNAYTS